MGKRGASREMKRLFSIALILLTTCVCYAGFGGYGGFDGGGVWQVVLADLPQDQLISDPSIKAWRIVVLGAQLERLGVDLSNVSKAKFDTWKNNPGTLDNPAWFVADAKNCDGTPEGVKAAWQAMQSENGLEPIPDN